MTRRISAHELIETVLDDESWVSWDGPAEQVAAPGSDYADELAAAADRAGTDEALITGRGRIAGHDVAVVVSEFGFLAGSIGHAASARLVQAVRRATRERLPLFAAPASGGTRMQEGTPAFVGMVKIAAAVTQHKAAGLPYIVYLRHPTTGGVFASWGSLGHFTAAEPGALLGFLGPRVFQALHDRPFPEGVQSAENLYRRGLVDAVLPITELAGVAAKVLDIVRAGRDVAGSRARAPDHRPAPAPARSTSTWDSILRSRRADRPHLRSLLSIGADVVVPLSGTGEGEHDDSLMMALARFGPVGCLVVGHDRRSDGRVAELGPAALRAARRGMRVAEELGIALVTVVDTAGAALSPQAEEGGLSAEIARCLSDLVMVGSPTVCVLLGEGTGGGALALLPADRVICAEHAWLSPLPPEGASAIVHRDVDHAEELAETQEVGADALLRRGIADRVVAEPDDPSDRVGFCRHLGSALVEELVELVAQDGDERFELRLARWERLG